MGCLVMAYLHFGRGRFVLAISLLVVDEVGWARWYARDVSEALISRSGFFMSSVPEEL
jgi:hypothetical protein